MAEQKTARATILAQIAGARAHAARARKAGRRATSATYDRKTGRVLLELTNGYMFGFPTKSIAALATATPEQLAGVKVSRGGGALRWESLDADLSVPGLLLASVGRTERLSELARLAGQTTSKAKAAAARANGAKGGRPRKERQR